MILDGPYSIPCNLTMDALMRCLLSSKFCWTCSTCRPFTHSVLWQSAPWLWSSYNPNRDQRLKAWHKVGVKGRYSFQGHSETSKRPLAVIGVVGWFWTYSICFNAFQPFSTPSILFTFLGWMMHTDECSDISMGWTSSFAITIHCSCPYFEFSCAFVPPSLCIPATFVYERILS
jgi:hypothetical protein